MSLYLHSIYENFTEKTYHQAPQVVGKLKHKAIDRGTYSSARRYVVGLEVWSEAYQTMGKIDIYDRKQRALIERKTRVKKIYDGYKYQLYAQYFAMCEMGYEVETLLIHSLEDNKRYEIPVPGEEERKEFERIIEQIRTFSIANFKNHSCSKCANSIYGILGW